MGGKSSNSLGKGITGVKSGWGLKLETKVALLNLDRADE